MLLYIGELITCQQIVGGGAVMGNRSARYEQLLVPHNTVAAAIPAPAQKCGEAAMCWALCTL